MKEVSKDTFFSVIGSQNCHPSLEGDYPYTSIFRLTNRVEVGRIENGATGKSSKYLLPQIEAIEDE